MGMTIDEAIPILHDMYNYYNDVDVDAYVSFDKEDNNAIETALDTMRKYQKIEKIVNNTFQNITKEDERYAYEWLGDIKEVIEDGNND